MKTTACLLGLLALGFTPVGSDTRAFFSSRESLGEEVARLIDQSRTTIDIALFDFQSQRLERALEHARSRGVFIRLILDARYGLKHFSETAGAGAFPSGEVRSLGGKSGHKRGVMHSKFAVFDKERVITGSYNWTPGAEHANYENLLLTDEPDSVRSFAREFEVLWRRATQKSCYPPPSSLLKSGGFKRQHPRPPFHKKRKLS